MSKGDVAKQNFLDGYTCAQAVIKAFENEEWFVQSGMNADSLLKIASSFGGGMGRLREVCGAVSGMFMLLGLKQGFAEPLQMEQKATHYQSVQDLAALFKQENGSIVCRELLGLSSNQEKPTTKKESTVTGDAFCATPEERTPEYYKKRPCADLCKSAADILERFFMGA